MKQLPSQEALRGLFAYDPETGVLTWLASKGRAKKGSRVGTPHSKGYRSLVLDGKRYYEHRLIWKLVYGEDPDTIDHINADRSDNRLCNLRSISLAENTRLGAEKRGDMPLGVRRVSKNGKFCGTYQARATIEGKLTNLGTYDTPDQAHQAYLEAIS